MFPRLSNEEHGVLSNQTIIKQPGPSHSFQPRPPVGVVHRRYIAGYHIHCCSNHSKCLLGIGPAPSQPLHMRWRHNADLLHFTAGIVAYVTPQSRCLNLAFAISHRVTSIIRASVVVLSTGSHLSLVTSWSHATSLIIKELGTDERWRTTANTTEMGSVSAPPPSAAPDHGAKLRAHHDGSSSARCSGCPCW